MREIEAAGINVMDLVRHVDGLYPGFMDVVIENGTVQRFVNVYVDDQNIRAMDGLGSAVGPTSVVELTFAVSGG
jgi:hypothetical protein